MLRPANTFAGAARQAAVRVDAFIVAAILVCFGMWRGKKEQQDACTRRLPAVC